MDTPFAPSTAVVPVATEPTRALDLPDVVWRASRYKNTALAAFRKQASLQNSAIEYSVPLYYDAGRYPEAIPFQRAIDTVTNEIGWLAGSPDFDLAGKRREGNT